MAALTTPGQARPGPPSRPTDNVVSGEPRQDRQVPALQTRLNARPVPATATLTHVSCQRPPPFHHEREREREKGENLCTQCRSRKTCNMVEMGVAEEEPVCELVVEEKFGQCELVCWCQPQALCCGRIIIGPFNQLMQCAWNSREGGVHGELHGPPHHTCDTDWSVTGTTWSHAACRQVKKQPPCHVLPVEKCPNTSLSCPSRYCYRNNQYNPNHSIVNTRFTSPAQYCNNNHLLLCIYRL